MTTLTTAAGRDLYAFWRFHQSVAHGVTDVHDALEDDVAAIEAEAAAAARAERDRLRTALENLLADTQHAEHSCKDADCPVAVARAALKGT